MTNKTEIDLFDVFIKTIKILLKWKIAIFLFSFLGLLLGGYKIITQPLHYENLTLFRNNVNSLKLLEKYTEFYPVQNLEHTINFDSVSTSHFLIKITSSDSAKLVKEKNSLKKYLENLLKSELITEIELNKSLYNLTKQSLLKIDTIYNKTNRKLNIDNDKTTFINSSMINNDYIQLNEKLLKYENNISKLEIEKSLIEINSSFCKIESDNKMKIMLGYFLSFFFISCFVVISLEIGKFIHQHLI